ncbi:MAG: TetR/AcrR family transcriptional regulator [Chloroflexi bacterium]|nr:TetR/AcrR family transcriptional regulator [Chloroflexota bacterium]
MSTRKQQTRDKILNSARRLLAERGYHGVGLEVVARDAGVSRQTIYRRFKSKAELLVALAEYGDELIGIPELLRPVREARTALEALDKGISAYAAIEPLIYDVWYTTYSARRSDPVAEAVWQNRMASRRESIRHDMELLQKEEILADSWTVEEATDFAWALLSVHTYEYLAVERKWAVEHFVQRLRETLRCILVKK